HARMRRLDPNLPSSIAYTWFVLGDRDQALETCSITAEPFRGYVLGVSGRTDEARAVLRDARALYSAYPLEVMFIDGMCAAMDGDREAATESIDALLRTDFSDPEGIYFLAPLSLSIGDVERAEQSLMLASERGFASLPQLENDPTLAPLRSSPRYARVRDEVEKRYREAKAAFEAAGGGAVL
ncbi:MAG: tetratricopeptide repeat protein, partial [Thermoanaerobaculia bacterium]